MLQDLATREVVRIIWRVSDLNSVLSRIPTWRRPSSCSEIIQNDANQHRLGVKILFVGVQDLHPPVKVAADYENVVAAEPAEDCHE